MNQAQNGAITFKERNHEDKICVAREKLQPVSKRGKTCIWPTPRAGKHAATNAYVVIILLISNQEGVGKQLT